MAQPVNTIGGKTVLTIAMVVFDAGLITGTARGQEKSAATATKPIETMPRDVNIRDRLMAHCIDGSVLRVHLLDAKIPLKTDYGTLEISAADIRRIEFATRLPDDLAQRVNAAIAKLNHDDYHVREAACAELLALQQVAYPALVTACESQDLEVAHRAEQLLDQIRKTVPQEDLDFQDTDVIYTDKSQIAGTIGLEVFKVNSTPLGQQQLKLVMLRRIDLGDEPRADVLPDPGNLSQYQNQVGKTLYFRVTAYPQNFNSGYVWGTDVYTLDSTLWMAAVHAGLLQPGQTKVVGVNIMGPQNAFPGSLRNNVNSGYFGGYPGSFRFETGRAKGPAARAQLAPAPQAVPQFIPGGFAPVFGQ